jgi:hypothetical protein
MLRGLLLALVLANLTFFVWSQGGLRTAGGTTAAGEHEPERLLRQVRPEAVQLLRPPVAASIPAAGASAASAAASTASGVEAASAASSAASEAASAPASAETSASAAVQASAASTASAGSAAVLALAPAPPPAPPGTRCVEAGPFNGVELASAETALAANAKTRRIARRWVQMTPDAASAPSTPQHQLRIDATPSEVAVLESLPASVVGRSFTPCTAR